MTDVPPNYLEDARRFAKWNYFLVVNRTLRYCVAFFHTLLSHALFSHFQNLHITTYFWTSFYASFAIGILTLLEIFFPFSIFYTRLMFLQVLSLNMKRMPAVCRISRSNHPDIISTLSSPLYDLTAKAERRFLASASAVMAKTRKNC